MPNAARRGALLRRDKGRATAVRTLAGCGLRGLGGGLRRPGGSGTVEIDGRHARAAVQSVGKCEDNEAGAATDLELGIDGGEVVTDCGFGDVERSGYGFVA